MGGTHYSMACKCGAKEDDMEARFNQSQTIYDSELTEREISESNNMDKNSNPSKKVKFIPEIHDKIGGRPKYHNASINESEKTSATPPPMKFSKSNDACLSTNSNYVIYSNDIVVDNYGEEDCIEQAQVRPYVSKAQSLAREQLELQISGIIDSKNNGPTQLLKTEKSSHSILTEGTRNVSSTYRINNTGKEAKEHTELVILQQATIRRKENEQNGRTKNVHKSNKSKLSNISINKKSELDINEIFSEEKLQSASDVDVIYQGELQKYNYKISASYNHNVNYSTKFVIFTKRDIRVYKSKESFLHLFNPNLSYNSNSIDYCSRLNIPNKKGLIHFAIIYDYPGCFDNPVFQEYFSSEDQSIIFKEMAKENKFYQQHKNFKDFCDHLSIYSSTSKEEIEKWMAIIHYCIKERKEALAS